MDDLVACDDDCDVELRQSPTEAQGIRSVLVGDRRRRSRITMIPSSINRTRLGLISCFLTCLALCINRDYRGMHATVWRSFDTSLEDLTVLPPTADPTVANRTNQTDSRISFPFVVLVISARENAERRRVIRETWASGHKNVFFVVSEPCRIPMEHRSDGAVCKAWPATLNKTISPTLITLWEKQEKELLEEHAQYGDIVFASEPESYRGLVHKLKEALDWAVQRTTAQWMLKADDDTFVRVDSVARYLQQLTPSNPTIVGRIVVGAPVWKTGKWADPHYKPAKYPPWPMGSCGYAVSRPIAEYVSLEKDNLYEYQGEDTSLGIWLNESAIKENITWHNSRAFVNEGKCEDPNALVIGHLIDPPKMRKCYDVLDETTNLPDHSLDKEFYPA